MVFFYLAEPFIYSEGFGCIPSCRDYHSIGGFSKLLLAQCIYEGYCVIYEEEDLEKYGVWGHEMGDLSLICAEYIPEEKYCMLSIVS